MFITDGNETVKIELKEWDGTRWGEDISADALAFEEWQTVHPGGHQAAVVDDLQYTVDMFADRRDGLVDMDGQVCEPDGVTRCLYVNDMPFDMGEPVENIPLAIEVNGSAAFGQYDLHINGVDMWTFDPDDSAEDIARAVCGFGLDEVDSQRVAQAVNEGMGGHVDHYELANAVRLNRC